MYGYGYPYGFYFDPTYVLLIIGMILALAASLGRGILYYTIATGPGSQVPVAGIYDKIENAYFVEKNY